MATRGYAVLGWVVWQVSSRVAKRKIRRNRSKVGALGLIGLVLVGGLLAARSDSES